jgi:hypothetical protein
MLNAASKYFNSTGVEYCGQGWTPPDDMNDFEKTVFDSISIYSSYDTTDPTFDTTNLQRFTADLPCPMIDEEMIHRYMRYGEEDRWGKRKETAPVVRGWIEDELSVLQAVQSEETPIGDRNRPLGLDVTGPGGGQWRLAVDGDDRLKVFRGLDGACAATLRIPGDVFLKLVRGDRSFSLSAIEAYLELSDGSVDPELLWDVLGRLFPRRLAPRALLDAASSENGVEARRGQVSALD